MSPKQGLPPLLTALPGVEVPRRVESQGPQPGAPDAATWLPVWGDVLHPVFSESVSVRLGLPLPGDGFVALTIPLGPTPRSGVRTKP